MVERLQGKKIVAVDLDGTLIKGNSLHEYMKAAIKHSNLPAQIILLSTIFLRALRIISHKKMKFTFLKWVKNNDRLKNDFIKRIEKIKNKKVLDFLSELEKAGYGILLASAAPDIYVPWIWGGQFVASRAADNPSRIECRGEEKVKAIEKVIGLDSEIAIVVTDHYDDLPLMRKATEKVILVNPNEKTLKKVSVEGVKFQLLRMKNPSGH